jgi:hypothetical protein
MTRTLTVDAAPIRIPSLQKRLPMKVVPLHLDQAKAFIRRHHRHSLPPVSGKFAIGAVNDDGELVGVAVCGRPVARMLDDGLTLEILRVCTDGSPNSGSFLYGRARRVASAMGYERVVTYTLKRESGASLRAAGARPTAALKPKEWTCPSRPRASQTVYREPKIRWDL